MIALAFLLPIGNPAMAAEPIEAVVWEFADGVQEWQGNNTTPLEVIDDALTFSATGSDVLIQGPLFDIEPDLCDVIEITLKSTTEGVCEWFWRSDTEGPYGGFSGERRLQVSVEGHDDWQTLRVQPFWQEAERVVGLRFDPPEGKEGTYAIRSIKVLKFERSGPVAAEFAYRRKGDKVQFSPDEIWYYGAAGEEYHSFFPNGKSPAILIANRKTGREIAQAYFPGSC